MNGEMSIMPMEGTTRRMGAMIGSVRSISTRWIGVFPIGSNQDMIARAMMPKLRMVRMSWMKPLTSLDIDRMPLSGWRGNCDGNAGTLGIAVPDRRIRLGMPTEPSRPPAEWDRQGGVWHAES